MARVFEDTKVEGKADRTSVASFEVHEYGRRRQMSVRAAFATLHFQLFRLVLVDTFALKMGMELGLTGF
jgi:hypothetical protein